MEVKEEYRGKIIHQHEDKRERLVMEVMLKQSSTFKPRQIWAYLLM